MAIFFNADGGGSDFLVRVDFRFSFGKLNDEPNEVGLAFCFQFRVVRVFGGALRSAGLRHLVIRGENNHEAHEPH